MSLSAPFLSSCDANTENAINNDSEEKIYCLDKLIKILNVNNYMKDKHILVTLTKNF